MQKSKSKDQKQNPEVISYKDTLIYKLLPVALIFALYVLNSTKVEASSFDLSVSPQIFQIQLTPPAVATANQTILLENKSDSPLPLTIKYQPFKPSGDNGEITYLSSSDHLGNDPAIYSRLTLRENNRAVNSLVIPPQTKKQLDLNVSVPKDEPPGDYYFSILFLKDMASASAQQSTFSSAVGGVAMNVLLSVGPKGKTTGTIDEFSTPFFQPEGPVSFKVRINNTSDHFIAPQAQIVITNMFGQKIGKVDLLPLNVLAHSSRSLPSKEQFQFAASGNPDKNKQITQIQHLLTDKEQAVAVWPETFLLGPYKATLTVAFSDEGPLYVKSVTFIGIPFYVILAFSICLILIVAIRSRLKHHEKK